MSADLPAGGLALFFLLGLRHGMEADHIAAIDGMTLRALDFGEPHAPWVGALFALGHAGVVIVLALVIGLFAASFALPPAVASVVDWLPLLLLVLLGGWNLRALLSPGEYRPDSLRLKLLPAALRQRTDIVSALLVGALFAMVLDTLAHVSAWSIFAAHQGGWLTGLWAGVLFSAGMLVTSTVDSQLVCRLLRSEPTASRVRQGMGWFVVLLSFGAAFQALAQRLDWHPLLDAVWLEWLAMASLVALLLLWAWRRGLMSKTKTSES
jgi:high-affinity nickel-transport protein